MNIKALIILVLALSVLIAFTQSKVVVLSGVDAEQYIQSMPQSTSPQQPQQQPPKEQSPEEIVKLLKTKLQEFKKLLRGIAITTGELFLASSKAKIKEIKDKLTQLKFEAAKLAKEIEHLFMKLSQFKPPPESVAATTLSSTTENTPPLSNEQQENIRKIINEIKVKARALRELGKKRRGLLKKFRNAKTPAERDEIKTEFEKLAKQAKELRAQIKDLLKQLPERIRKAIIRRLRRPRNPMRGSAATEGLSAPAATEGLSAPAATEGLAVSDTEGLSAPAATEGLAVPDTEGLSAASDIEGLAATMNTPGSGRGRGRGSESESESGSGSGSGSGELELKIINKLKELKQLTKARRSLIKKLLSTSDPKERAELKVQIRKLVENAKALKEEITKLLLQLSPQKRYELLKQFFKHRRH